MQLLQEGNFLKYFVRFLRADDLCRFASTSKAAATCLATLPALNLVLEGARLLAPIGPLLARHVSSVCVDSDTACTRDALQHLLLLPQVQQLSICTLTHKELTPLLRHMPFVKTVKLLSCDDKILKQLCACESLERLVLSEPVTELWLSFALRQSTLTQRVYAIHAMTRMELYRANGPSAARFCIEFMQPEPWLLHSLRERMGSVRVLDVRNAAPFSLEHLSRVRRLHCLRLCGTTFTFARRSVEGIVKRLDHLAYLHVDPCPLNVLYEIERALKGKARAVRLYARLRRESCQKARRICEQLASKNDLSWFDVQDHTEEASTDEADS